MVLNTLPTLVNIATEDSAPPTRKKAIYALSSAVRNYQPAMNEVVKHLPEGYSRDKVDAGDMEAVDSVINRLRSHPVQSSG